MSSYLMIIGAGLIAAFASLLFSSLTYSLRDLSRPKFSEMLEQLGRKNAYDPTIDHINDLIFVTAVGRLFANILILLAVLRLFEDSALPKAGQYLLSMLCAGLISLFCSIAVPNSVSKYAGEQLVAHMVGFLHGMRLALWPLTAVMHGVDFFFRRATGASEATQPQEVEQEILAAVEEGEKEGVVDEQEREMIVSVIQFRDTQAGQIMTARTEIVGLEVGASVTEVRQMIEESGHSRLPVFDGTLDKIIGVLYARDLLKHLGHAHDHFDLRSAIRPAFYVPETKPLRDLLNDFRLQKVHIAIVLDEYGGTAGLVTIEDILEELVGEISDEHEPSEPSMLKRISENVWEADARIYIDELNRVVGLNLVEDAGYDTLGGFISTTVSRIPQKDDTFEHSGAKFTVIDAEPQKVNRVLIEVLPQPAESAPRAT